MFQFPKVFADIMYKEGLHNGPKHLFRMIELIRYYMDSDEQAVLFKSIQENSYLANPENILLAMAGKFNFIGRG